VCINHTRDCDIHMNKCQNYTRVCVCKTHSTCENHTLRVATTLVRAEVALVRVLITFVLVKIVLRVGIKL
jgi:hypothetical protein